MLQIRALTTADLDFGWQLSTAAGWNQTSADWRRFLLLQPDGCWLAEWNGVPAGTVVVCGFGDVAWIAMMLVAAPLRGRGIGRALMNHALGCADQLGARSVRLDATPLGQPLYESLGFRGDFSLTRYGGIPHPTPHLPVSVTQVTAASAAELDQRACGTNRRKLLAALFAEHSGWGVLREGSLAGFCTMRPGRTAYLVGPCVASAEVGTELLTEVMERLAGESVLMDVPDQHKAARQVVEAMGLTPQRSLLRMTRGAPLPQSVELLWASSGGEKG